MNKARLLLREKVGKATDLFTKINHKIFFYCSHCKNVSTFDSIYDESLLVEEGDRKEEGKVCQHCGKTLNESYYNKISAKSKTENKKLVDISVWKNEEKVSINFFFIHPYITPQGNMVWNTSNKRFCINTKSGQSYMLPWKMGNICIEENHIVNITYSGYCMELASATDKVIKLLNDIICPKLALNNLTNYEKIRAIIIANRLPQLTDSQVRQIVKNGSVNLSKIFKGTNKNQSGNEFIATVCKNINVPNTKGIRKMLQDFKNIYGFFSIKHLLKDVNCKRNFVNAVQNSIIFARIGNDTEITLFLKDLIAVKGEANVTKMFKNPKMFNNDTPFFANTEYGYLLDAARLWHDFILAGETDERLLRGSFKEIHDKLSEEVISIRDKAASMPYDNAEYLSWESAYNERTFKLAESPKELIRVGSEMGICVGGSYYCNRMRNKKIVIILVINNNKYEACIEVDIDGKAPKMIQAKTKFNHLPEGSLKENIIKWAFENNIETNDCYDLINSYDNNNIF